MLTDLLDRAKRDRENANRARQVGTGIAITVRYLWAVGKWAFLIVGLGILSLVWIILTIIFQPLRGK